MHMYIYVFVYIYTYIHIYVYTLHRITCILAGWDILRTEPSRARIMIRAVALLARTSPAISRPISPLPLMMTVLALAMAAPVACT